MRKYKFGTIKQELAVLRDVEYYTDKQIAQRHGINSDRVRNIRRRHGIKRTDEDGKFKRKHKSWNKGMKGLTQLGGETKFKAGSTPHNTVPIGTLRYNKDGLLEIKYVEHKWRSLHSHIWIEAFGPIPDKHIVVFKIGVEDKTNPKLEQLELISRAESINRVRVRKTNCKQLKQ